MSGIKVNGISKRIGGRPSLSSGSSVLKSLSINLLVGAVMMYVGIGIGIRVELQDCTKECAKQTVDTLRQSVAGDISGSGGGSDNGEGERILKSEAAVECAKLVENACGKSSSKAKTETSKSTGTRFPYNVKLFATGLAQVDRETFAKRFDVGVPLDKSEHGNDRLLILYNDPMGLPNDEDLARAIGGSGEVPLIENIEQATENCDVLDLTLIQSKTKRQCFAMMGQYQSFHIQKFMRLPEQAGQRLDPKAPLRLVNRGAQPTGRLSAKPPKKEQTLTYWNTLKTYLDTLESVLAELQPLAEKVARQNTVIVMVCNHGQSELLMNFVCSARSRNLDLSAILVFATDEETKELAIGLGLTAFFDKIVSFGKSPEICVALARISSSSHICKIFFGLLESKNYGSAPKTAARSYGDRAFTAMMMAKVYCVQMISFLGYDLLFQGTYGRECTCSIMVFLEANNDPIAKCPASHLIELFLQTWTLSGSRTRSNTFTTSTLPVMALMFTSR